MRVMCIQCEREIETQATLEATSHGLCHDCLPDLLVQYGITQEELLETYTGPMALFDGDGAIVKGNCKFQDYFGQENRLWEHFLDTQLIKISENEASSPQTSVRKVLHAVQHQGDEHRNLSLVTVHPHHGSTRSIYRLHARRFGEFISLEMDERCCGT